MTQERHDQVRRRLGSVRISRHFVIGAAALSILGCTVTLVDETDSPVPQSSDNSYVINLRTEPDPYVISVDTPEVLVGGTWHEMEGGAGSNEWEHVQVASPTTSEIQYRFRVSYIFNASLIPGINLFTNQGTSFSPSSATFHALAIEPAAKMPGDELLQVPIRWCAIEGSSAVENPAAVNETSTDDVLMSRHIRASDHIWIPGAGISFRSAMIAAAGAQANFPIIPDPNPPPSGPGQEGDLEIVNTASAPEVREAIADCEAAWDLLEQNVGANIEGLIVVNIRNFVVPSGGTTPYQGLQFFSAGLQCSQFNSQAQSVCQNPLNYPSNAGAAVVLRDNVTRLQFEPHENTLAHELGHALFLGHGNGIDDDGDGNVDRCCDADEDPYALPVSLMCPECTSDVLTLHQRDYSRAIAQQTPGAVVDPPAILKPVDVYSDQRVDTRHDAEQPGLDLVWTGMSENLRTGETMFTHTLFGLIPENAGFRYILFVDLDDDMTTGLSPRDIGYETRLNGISLIVDVSVRGSGADPETVLYVAGKDTWLDRSDGSQSFIGTAVEAETGIRLFDSVNTVIGTDIVGRAGERVAIRTESHSEDSGLADVLPDTAESTKLLIKPPDYPVCSVEPLQARPGETVDVTAFGLIPKETAEVVLRDESIAADNIDDRGTARIKFRIPETARSGIQLISVGAGNSAVSADCAVMIVEDD